MNGCAFAGRGCVDRQRRDTGVQFGITQVANLHPQIAREVNRLPGLPMAKFQHRHGGGDAGGGSAVRIGGNRDQGGKYLVRVTARGFGQD